MKFFRNKFLKTSIVALVICGIFLPVFGNVAHAGFWDAFPTIGLAKAIGNYALSTGLENLTDVILRLCAMFLALAGAGLDAIIKFTVVEMSDRFSSDPSKIASMGIAISDAWGTIRDIANLAFIFVLLYAAIKVILDLQVSSIGSTIRNIIIVGLLINFSMFFTKVVIDASNIATIGFYNSIQSSVQGEPLGVVKGWDWKVEPGMASVVMRAIGVQSIFGDNILSFLNSPDQNYLITVRNVMGSIIMIVLTIVFLVVTVMFISRFILLIFLTVLSAAAAVAFILPGLKVYFSKWKDSLISQAAFAPIFMLMFWISMKMMYSFAIIAQDGTGRQYQFSNISGAPLSMLGMIMNFFLVVGFIIASLIIAKNMASKSFGFSAINSLAGTATFGAAALAGRQTFGRMANRIANDKELQLKAKAGDIGARMKLATASKMASGTYDIRNVGNTKVGKAVGADKMMSGMGTIYGQGGFAAKQKERDDKKKERVAAQRLLDARTKVVAGVGAAPGTSERDEMEKTLSRMSDKEVESLVSNNKKLLEDSIFANTISVKQLEAINKSDQFTDAEKDTLKNTRFADIYGAVRGLAPGATIPTGPVMDKIKSLTDSELEMLDPDMLKDDRFIGELKQSQIDGIEKSSRFTRTQKDKIKETRLRPLKNALTSGNIGLARNIFKKADIKTKVAYMRIEGRPGTNIALDGDLLDTYTVKTLTKMAAHDNMSDSDISTLRAALTAHLPVGNAVRDWLEDPAKGMVEFPA